MINLGLLRKGHLETDATYAPFACSGCPVQQHTVATDVNPAVPACHLNLSQEHSQMHPCICADLGQMRLGASVVSEDGAAEYGRLEELTRSGWIAASLLTDDDTTEQEAATNACRSLGYQQGAQIQQLVCCVS